MIIIYFLIFVTIFSFILNRKNYRWYRKLMGGTWYKHLDISNSPYYEWNRNPFGYLYKEQWIIKNNKKHRTYIKMDTNNSLDKQLIEEIKKIKN